MKKLLTLLTLLFVCLSLFACGGKEPDVNPPEKNPIPAEVQAEIDALNLTSLKFTDKTVTYDGTKHRINISGYLPKNVSVEFENNGISEAGVHTVSCKLLYAHTDASGVTTKYHFKTLTATLTVNTATYDLSGVRFGDATLTYTGKPLSLAITGALPEGVSVSYVGNGQTDVGVYTVTAKFTGDRNHNAIPDRTATLTVAPASYDMSEVYLFDKTVGADGSAHSILCVGRLPEGVSVSYVGNGQSAPGEYTVTAKFTSDNPNYKPISDLSATLTVSELKLPGVSVRADAFVYNGEVHTNSLLGDMPDGYTVAFEGEAMTDAGLYTVTAKFSDADGVYHPEYDLTATCAVLPAELSLSADDLTVEYDGAEKSIVLKGAVPEGITLVEYGNRRIAPGTYRVIFRPVAENPGNYKNLTDITATLTITEKTVEATADGLLFEVINGKCTVVGYNGSDSVVIIPSENGGLSVKSIKTEAFLGNTKIKYVVIPDSVTNIGNSAFRGCTSLREVDLGDSVTTIGLLAFEGTALIDVTLPDSLEFIGHGAFRSTPMEHMTLPFIGASRDSSSKYLGYIFGADGYVGNLAFVPETLRSLTLSDGCEIIPAYSLYGCASLESVRIGSGVTEIGISAFAHCTSLKSVYIPASVKSIPAAAEYYNSPFFACSEELIIVLGHTSAPHYNATPENPDGTGFADYWKYVGENTLAEVVFNKTLDEYLAEYGE